MKEVTWAQLGQTGYDMLAPAYVTEANAKLVYTSGCVGTDPATGEIPEDLEQQARLAFANLKAVLEASGSSMDNILKVLLFVADGSYATVVNKVYKEYFPARPARSCIVVGFPSPALKLELECVAEAKN